VFPPHVIPLRGEKKPTDLCNHHSTDEIALYDRQIRLWGVQAQEKIRNAHILLVNVKALGNEVAKNLVLAGIASLTVVDNGIVTPDDLGAQFFLTEHDIGQPVRDT